MTRPRRRSLEERLSRYRAAELNGSPDLPPVTRSQHPTLGELEALLAVVERSAIADAAAAAGVSSRTIRNHLTNLYAKIGATSRAHAAWLLWPVLGDAYRLPGDPPENAERRSGRDRRRAA